MDNCKKLAIDACMHAVQNEGLLLRVVVRVFFFEHVKAAATHAASFPRQTDMLHAKSAEGFDTPSLPYKEGHWFQTPRGGAIILIEKGVRLVFWGEKG